MRSGAATARVAQVKRWQGSDRRLALGAQAMLYAESRWNRPQGYRRVLLPTRSSMRALLLSRTKINPLLVLEGSGQLS